MGAEELMTSVLGLITFIAILRPARDSPKRANFDKLWSVLRWVWLAVFIICVLLFW